MNDGNNQKRWPRELPGTAEGDPSRDPLAASAHRVLRQLPGRRAPVGLAPRIFAEIARRSQLVWYQRPWTDWPEILRWLSTMILAGTVAALLRLLEGGWASSKSTPALAAVHDVPVFFEAAESGGRALLYLVHALPPTWLLVGGCVVVATFAGTLGLTTAAWRLAKSDHR